MFNQLTDIYDLIRPHRSKTIEVALDDVLGKEFFFPDDDMLRKKMIVAVALPPLTYGTDRVPTGGLTLAAADLGLAYMTLNHNGDDFVKNKPLRSLVPTAQNNWNPHSFRPAQLDFNQCKITVVQGTPLSATGTLLIEFWYVEVEEGKLFNLANKQRMARLASGR